MNCMFLQTERKQYCEKKDQGKLTDSIEAASAASGVNTTDAIEAEQAAEGYQLHQELDILETVNITSNVTATSCPADISIDLGNFGSVSVPLSNWCSIFELIAILVRLSAGFISFNMLFATIRNI